MHGRHGMGRMEKKRGDGEKVKDEGRGGQLESSFLYAFLLRGC